MAAQRVRSDDVTVSFTGPRGLEDVGMAQSFETELMLEILEERYLGETAARYDDIFKGVSGKCVLHIPTKGWFTFTQRVQDRAQRRIPAGSKFTCTGSFAFPDGTRARLVFDDIFFEGMPLNVPGGGAYVAVTVSFKCSDVQRLL